MTDDILELRSVSKSFGTTAAVRGVDLLVRPGEVFSLLGPSGCGKTTLLRMIAGFERPDRGEIHLGGKNITGDAPERRPVNTVFQSYALFPHLSVFDNIIFGPRQAGVVEEERIRRGREIMELMEIADQAEKRPSQLSGGQKQRVAIARALINHPKLLLLDEPLGALDLKLRQRMLLELDRIHEEVGITFLYVTHDQGEAMSLSDRIAVMNAGRIEQLGTPEEIYNRPCSRFVATFIGDTNLLSGRLVSGGGGGLVRFEVEGVGAFLVPGLSDGEIGSGGVSLSVRPESLRVCSGEPGETVGGQPINKVRARLEERIYLGSHSQLFLRSGSVRWQVVQPHGGNGEGGELPVESGQEAWISWSADAGVLVRDPVSGEGETP